MLRKLLFKFFMRDVKPAKPSDRVGNGDLIPSEVDFSDTDVSEFTVRFDDAVYHIDNDSGKVNVSKKRSDE